MKRATRPSTAFICRSSPSRDSGRGFGRYVHYRAAGRASKPSQKQHIPRRLRYSPFERGPGAQVLLRFVVELHQPLRAADDHDGVGHERSRPSVFAGTDRLLLGSRSRRTASIFVPTLEMRITDCCTTLEDTLSIAALFRNQIVGRSTGRQHVAATQIADVRFAGDAPLERTGIEPLVPARPERGGNLRFGLHP